MTNSAKSCKFPYELCLSQKFLKKDDGSHDVLCSSTEGCPLSLERFLGAKHKDDGGKLMLSLVPPEIINQIAKVRMFGVGKYKDPDNWKKVSIERYHNALLRHITKCWENINAVDSDSGLLHIAHAATNIAFILALLEGSNE